MSDKPVAGVGVPAIVSNRFTVIFGKSPEVRIVFSDQVRDGAPETVVGVMGLTKADAAALGRLLVDGSGGT